MTYEDGILDVYARTKKRMARDLAVCSDLNIVLDLDKWPYSGSFPNPAAIKIYKVRLVNEDTFA